MQELLAKHREVKSAYADLNRVKWDTEHEQEYDEKWELVNQAYYNFLMSYGRWLNTFKDDELGELKSQYKSAMQIGKDNGLWWNKWSRSLFVGVDVVLVPLFE